MSSFIAKYEPDVCVGCGVCLGRCQMEAISNDGGGISLNTDRCIGCGLCVSTCPNGALKLIRKPEGTQREVPGTFYDTWYKIVEDQSERR